MQALKGFLNRAAEGHRVRMLFIVPDAKARHDFKIALGNEANARRIATIFRNVDNSVFVGDYGLAVIRIAHAHLHEQIRGHTWHAVHGFEHLDRFENADDIKAHITERVRLT